MAYTTLITGASSGIGLALARRLAAEGHRVVNFDVAEPEEAVGSFHRVDLADRTQVRDGIAAVLATGPVDHLVNNAGLMLRRKLEDVDLDDLQKVVEVNMRSAVQLAQAVVPGMRAKKRGRIVSVATRAILGKELRTAYSGTKAALIGFTRVWALEFARDGITVNAVAPGPVHTKLWAAANPPGDPVATGAQVPVGRMGQPEDIANAIRFFLSDDASFVTGQTLFVCGGASIGSMTI